ncbi:hypothetical protein V1525DRAFT_143446 [Lipomyces kononenkoae]|uniref:Uncharacterized protein n=1 Tax=Lipomyces kononenkoae TaxID=34357 RepID=A0ACC3TB90_LIPKO
MPREPNYDRTQLDGRAHNARKSSLSSSPCRIDSHPRPDNENSNRNYVLCSKEPVHMHVIESAQPSPAADPPYSSRSSLSSSPLSSSQSESSSPPFELDFGDHPLLNVDSDFAMEIGMPNTVGTELHSFEDDECVKNLFDLPLDSLLSYSSPIAYIDRASSDIEEPDDSYKRLKRQKTPFLPMMCPGSDPSAFLFPGEHEQVRHYDEFLLSRTIAPALLSSSSASTTSTSETESEGRNTTPPSAASIPFMSTPCAATSDTLPSRVSDLVEESYLFETDTILDDVVETDHITAPVQHQPDDLDRTTCRTGTPETVVQPSTLDQTRSPAKSSNFAVVIPSHRQCGSADAHAPPARKRRPSTIRLRSSPTDTIFVAARKSTRRSRSVDESASRPFHAQKRRKLSDPGLAERSGRGRNVIVKDAVGPAVSRCSTRFAIVIKAQDNNNNKAVEIQPDSPWHQFHLHDSNRRQKIFARLALAVGSFAVGLGVARIFS